jgi:hypothetical protein
MLFSFNKFWKTLCLIMASWVVYGIFNFEIVVITLLCLIVSRNFQDTREMF